MAYGGRIVGGDDKLTTPMLIIFTIILIGIYIYVLVNY